eukprot:scaffold73180_cov65-Attheya_sp.AAC.1
MVCTKNPSLPCDRFDGNPAARFGTAVGYVELYVGYVVPVQIVLRSYLRYYYYRQSTLSLSIVGPSVVLPPTRTGVRSVKGRMRGNYESARFPFREGQMDGRWIE